MYVFFYDFDPSLLGCVELLGGGLVEYYILMHWLSGILIFAKAVQTLFA